MYYLILDQVNFLWMNGNNVFIPQSQTEHSPTIDPVFFNSPMPHMEPIQPKMVSIRKI